MAVSRPAPAVSKNVLSVIAVSATAEHAHEHGGRVAAEGMGETDLGTVDLARPGLAAKLGHDLDDLSGAGGADRMALGLQAARRVHGNLAAEARPAFLGRDPARAPLAHSHPLRPPHPPP